MHRVFRRSAHPGNELWLGDTECNWLRCVRPVGCAAGACEKWKWVNPGPIGRSVKESMQGFTYRAAVLPRRRAWYTPLQQRLAYAPNSGMQANRWLRAAWLRRQHICRALSTEISKRARMGRCKGRAYAGTGRRSG